MSKAALRSKAEELRNKGFSYSDIKAVLGVSKSTLSLWLRDVPYKPNSSVLDKITRARIASGVVKTRIRKESEQAARACAEADVGRLTKRDIFMLGLGVYIGEGAKTDRVIRLSNANPDIIAFGAKWFVEACGLAKENLRLRMHLYPDNDEAVCMDFWSKAAGLPRDQFYRTVVDRRMDKKMGKKGKLPYGTAHLSVKSGGKKEFGVFLSRRINAWIEFALSLKTSGIS